MSGKEYSREFKEDAVRQVTERGIPLALRVCLSARGLNEAGPPAIRRHRRTHMSEIASG